MRTHSVRPYAWEFSSLVLRSWLGRSAYGVRPHTVVLHRYDRFPTELHRVLDGGQFRIGGAVEDHVEPVVLLQSFGGLVLVGRESDLAHVGTPFHLDEPHGQGR